MGNIILTIHIIIAVCLVFVILLQRSEGGALGIGGGGGGFMGGRSAASALTRTTVILAAAFFATSIGLGLMSESRTRPAGSIVDTVNDRGTTPSAPAGDANESPAPQRREPDKSDTAPKPPAAPEAKKEGAPTPPEPR